MAKALETRSLGMGAKPAVIVVDASVGFVDPDSPLGADFDAELFQIGRILDHAHQSGWPCFFSTVVYHTMDQASVFRERVPALNLLTPRSPLVAIDPGLPRIEIDTVFEKQLASCFFDTGLLPCLQNDSVDTLVVTGFTTSGCVRATAVDSLQHNFRTLVVVDAVGDRDPDAHQANLYDLGAKYADLVTCDELLKLSVRSGAKPLLT